MYGILGEDESDTATLKVLVRRLAGNPALPVKCTKYTGSGELLNNGRRDLRLMSTLGFKKFVVCHDADGPDPAVSRDKVLKRIVEPSGLADVSCVVIPVQELEAWLLADIKAVTKLFSSWKPKAIANPESIPSPKEHLERLSEDQHRRKRYSHAVHNERQAEHIDLARVEKLCRSFKPLVAFVAAGV